MIARSNAEKAAERHHGIGHLARILVDHQIVNRSEMLAVAVVDRCADGFVGGDEAVGFVSSHCAAQAIALRSALRSKEVSIRKRRIESIVPLVFAAPQ